jgi:hypothetical protein
MLFCSLVFWVSFCIDRHVVETDVVGQGTAKVLKKGGLWARRALECSWHVWWVTDFLHVTFDAVRVT